MINVPRGVLNLVRVPQKCEYAHEETLLLRPDFNRLSEVMGDRKFVLEISWPPYVDTSAYGLDLAWLGFGRRAFRWASRVREMDSLLGQDRGGRGQSDTAQVHQILEYNCAHTKSQWGRGELKTHDQLCISCFYSSRQPKLL